jgi:phospholipase/carboxylesterase
LLRRVGAVTMRAMAGGPFFERFLAPREAAPGSPPLVVLLHGIGADEHDLLPLASRLDPRLAVASLRAPHDYVVGYAWFPIAFHPDGTVVPDVLAARAALADLTRWLGEAPSRLGTDPGRTFLLGFSQGAMMSLGALLTVPERLAGVVALSGRFAPALLEATAPPDAVARVPLLVAHGRLDDVLPVEHGRAIRQAFGERVADFTYREFPIGHEISPEEMALVADWIAERA